MLRAWERQASYMIGLVYSRFNDILGSHRSSRICLLNRKLGQRYCLRHTYVARGTFECLTANTCTTDLYAGSEPNSSKSESLPPHADGDAVLANGSDLDDRPVWYQRYRTSSHWARSRAVAICRGINLMSGRTSSRPQPANFAHSPLCPPRSTLPMYCPVS